MDATRATRSTHIVPTVTDSRSWVLRFTRAYRAGRAEDEWQQEVVGVRYDRFLRPGT